MNFIQIEIDKINLKFDGITDGNILILQIKLRSIMSFRIFFSFELKCKIFYSLSLIKAV